MPKLTKKQYDQIRMNVEGLENASDEEIQKLVDEQDAIDRNAVAS